jgi:hypothetical protein
MAYPSWTQAIAGRRGTVTERDDASYRYETGTPDAVIDLSQVPEATHLYVQVASQSRRRREVTLRGARDGQKVTVSQHVAVKVEGATKIGTVEFALRQTQPGRSGAASFEGVGDQLLVSEGTVELKGATINELRLTDGTVTGDLSHVGSVVVAGECMLPPDVSRVVVDSDGATLHVSNQSIIESLEMSGVGDEPCLRITGGRQGSARRSTLQRVIGVGRIELEYVDLAVEEIEGELTVGGTDGSVLRVPAGRTISSVALLSPVRLDAGPGAAVLRFSGELRAGQCKHATVVARTADGFEYVGLARTNASRQAAPEQLAGATLRGMFVPDTADGRQRLQELREAAVVEPRVDALRVRSPQWRRPFVRKQLTADIASKRALDDAAFFAEELAGLVAQKCGAGSVRTKSSWAAYRGRHLTAESPWERAALVGYRLVGYGQRPGPPLLLWLALSVALTPAILALTGWPTVPITEGAFWAEAGEQLLSTVLSPLFLLRLAGDPQLSPVNGTADLIVVVVRTVVAAPFVFFVLATARFLRAEWPW